MISTVFFVVEILVKKSKQKTSSCKIIFNQITDTKNVFNVVNIVRNRFKTTWKLQNNYLMRLFVVETIVCHIMLIDQKMF